VEATVGVDVETAVESDMRGPFSLFRAQLATMNGISPARCRECGSGLDGRARIAEPFGEFRRNGLADANPYFRLSCTDILV
jgi:hypothetical protein